MKKILTMYFLIIFIVLPFSVFSGVVHYAEETYFKSIRQLTFGGENAEAYFSFDDKKITFQATAYEAKCDQIFQFDLSDGDMSATYPRLTSTGLGRTTCSYFYPDNLHALYASTHLAEQNCPPAPCDNQTILNDTFLADLCANHTYLWGIYPQFDIFKINPVGIITQQLTAVDGYDAEGTISPDGKKIVFTSMRSGDLELYTMNLDGSDVTQITNDLGYDGGAFFSPDSKRLIFRASRPKTQEEITLYKELLKRNLVSPLLMELFVVNADGSNMTQITHLGNANWAPFFHPSGKKIIFSSNWNSSGGFNFNLYLINDDGTGLEQVTYDPTFDAFPMFSFDGTKLIFASTRNGSSPEEINLFLAEWTDDTKVTTDPNDKSVASKDKSLKILMGFICGSIVWLNH